METNQRVKVTDRIVWRKFTQQVIDRKKLSRVKREKWAEVRALERKGQLEGLGWGVLGTRGESQILGEA